MSDIEKLKQITNSETVWTKWCLITLNSLCVRQIISVGPRLRLKYK